MKKKIRAILIDSNTGLCTETEIEQGSLQDLYRVIGCKTIEVVRSRVLQGRDVIYVDEEGLLHDPTLFFKIDGFPQPIAGNGLVVGTDSQGDDIDVKTPLDVIKRSVQF